MVLVIPFLYFSVLYEFRLELWDGVHKYRLFAINDTTVLLTPIFLFIFSGILYPIDTLLNCMPDILKRCFVLLKPAMSPLLAINAGFSLKSPGFLQ